MEEIFKSIERHQETAFWCAVFIIIALGIIVSIFKKGEE